jgi:hypothetical protein
MNGWFSTDHKYGAIQIYIDSKDYNTFFLRILFYTGLKAQSMNGKIYKKLVRTRNVTSHKPPEYIA